MIDKDKFAYWLLGGLMALCFVLVVAIINLGIFFWK